MPVHPNSKTHENLSAKALDGTSLTIKLGQQELSHQAGETVLDTLERNGIEAEYNCREGFCGVCRTKLQRGSVDYTLDPLAFIEDDEILTCCTVPKSNIDIKVDY